MPPIRLIPTHNECWLSASILNVGLMIYSLSNFKKNYVRPSDLGDCYPQSRPRLQGGRALSISFSVSGRACQFDPRHLKCFCGIREVALSITFSVSNPAWQAFPQYLECLCGIREVSCEADNMTVCDKSNVNSLLSTRGFWS